MRFVLLRAIVGERPCEVRRHAWEFGEGFEFVWGIVGLSMVGEVCYGFAGRAEVWRAFNVPHW